jgi:hypothetical protein
MPVVLEVSSFSLCCAVSIDQDSLITPRVEAFIYFSDLLASEITSTPGDQINDQNDQRYDQKNVNQAAGNMEAEA